MYNSWYKVLLEWFQAQSCTVNINNILIHMSFEENRVNNQRILISQLSTGYSSTHLICLRARYLHSETDKSVLLK